MSSQTTSWRSMRVGSGDPCNRIAGLGRLEFDVEVTGFSLAEIDLVIDSAADSCLRCCGLAGRPLPAPQRTCSDCRWRPLDLGTPPPPLRRCARPARTVPYSRTSGWISFSLIHHTMCRSTGTSAAWARSNTVSSPWQRARCRRPPSRNFLRSHSSQLRSHAAMGHSVRVHGLAPYGRAAGRRWSGLCRDEEPRGME